MIEEDKQMEIRKIERSKRNIQKDHQNIQCYHLINM